MKNMLEKVWQRKHNYLELSNIIHIEKLVNNIIQTEELTNKENLLPRQNLPSLDDQKNDQDLSDHLVALWEPSSMASEQYRELRTRILDASQKDGKRVFLISSAISGEGKTLVATNLAISLASGVHETALLIDADLRNPNVSCMLGLEKTTKGLAEYLTDGGNLSDFITRTSIHKLNVITSGSPPQNPSELISSEYMSNLVKEVKHRYNNRYIIIDAPPLVPVTDSVVLSSLVDGIIIVVKALSTQREIVDNALAKIEAKEKILGLVINYCKGNIPYPYYKYYNKDNNNNNNKHCKT
ncbi:MAG: polysaccharide biosynthesis tyrosine autokinase [bacterium]